MDAAVGVAACAGVASAEGMPRSAVVLAEGMASAVFGGGGVAAVCAWEAGNGRREE